MTAEDEDIPLSLAGQDPAPQREDAGTPATLAERYALVREETETLALPLSAEDQSIQSMPDASPAKWHRAHVTWFFETVILQRFLADYDIFNPDYAYLFNSYYESLGERHPRATRGQISRPNMREVGLYRAHVDRAMQRLLTRTRLAEASKIRALVELGLHHEQQHQELLLTDILHAFAGSPLKPAYGAHLPAPRASALPMRFIEIEGGEVVIGHQGGDFAFDNERPAHAVLLAPYRIADRAVTNGEWMEFIADGGYANPMLWLADGWAMVQREKWTAPLYWEERDGGWRTMTLAGMRDVAPDAPVTHISYYEADAYARWRGKRLPGEGEWEHALHVAGDAEGRLAGSRCFRPLPARDSGTPLKQMIGDVWEWTSSPYAPYPGFAPFSGAVAEYNGKFMVNQMVLKGGSCVTPEGHIRGTYRNFFYPHQRWQFTGLRLAEDVPRPAGREGAEEDPQAEFRAAVLAGLAAPQKTLPCKYFYDAEGGRLFDAITRLAEYYPTRTETELLKRTAKDLLGEIDENTVLVEFGAGTEDKACIFFDVTQRISDYVPIEINRAALQALKSRLAKSHPHICVTPVAADFSDSLSLPAPMRARSLLGFFPGSTIGNFEREEAVALLRRFREMLGENARLILGIDLVKPREILLSAYDDRKGVTAAFNKNLLARINATFDGDIDLTAFAHRAVWNAEEARIEMHLVSRRAQNVTVAGQRFAFAQGESIHTESSHKYTIESATQLCRDAGWSVAAWRDGDPGFSVFLLR